MIMKNVVHLSSRESRPDRHAPCIFPRTGKRLPESHRAARRYSVRSTGVSEVPGRFVMEITCQDGLVSNHGLLI